MFKPKNRYQHLILKSLTYENDLQRLICSFFGNVLLLLFSGFVLGGKCIFICCNHHVSFSEWIILRTGGQTWYNYFIPPTPV